MQINKKTAFTLAETLITLVIIGVVASITIPSVVVKYQKDQTVVQLKKAYTTLAQAVRLSESENGPNKDWDWGTEGNVSESFNTYWKPYLKIQKICNTYSGCGYHSAYPWTSLNNTSYDVACVAPTLRTSVILQDGTFVIVRNYGGTPVTLYKQIYVDLNGPKPPNQLGKDLFQFLLDDQKGLVPTGYESDGNVDCSVNKGGLSCATKIIQDGWQITDDYPWQ